MVIPDHAESEQANGPLSQPQPFFSRQALAERWDVCPHTIARRKDLKPVRFNARLLRYRREDVLAVEAAGQ